ncbi:SIR2 family protein [Sphingobacterium suaedae]|uniref:SIR2 family protein n=1 Tax=Sphingobacterium suaedae TaxID=1686402 RepID=A0ABW5KNZ8_9SPHI
MEAYALEIDPNFAANKEEFLPFADKVKECLGDDRYYNFIYDTFKPREQTHYPFHETLCRLPFKAITTTNYDIVLEHALTIVTKQPHSSLHFEGTTKSKILDFLQSLNFNKFSRKFIAHLHGIYDSNDSIVLGGKEYSSKYGFQLGENDGTLFDQLQKGGMSQERITDLLVKYGYEWPLRRKLLWSLLATRRIVFIGFSMNDPYFIKMLDFVKDDLSTYNAETHFLVLRVTPSNLQRSIEHAHHLKREYGIQTFFFQDEEGKYPGLGQFIAELENVVNNSQETVETPPKVTEVAEAIPAGDKALTDKLFSISKKQYTDED